MDIFGYPWIYPLSEQKAMDIHGYIHTGLCSQNDKKNNSSQSVLLQSFIRFSREYIDFKLEC
jgi:hypothetical protein